MKKFLPLVCLLTLAGPVSARTLFLAGDSTLAPARRGNIKRGSWGDALIAHLRPGNRISNHAAGGRSTKSFRDEGRWSKLLSEVRTGDFVLICFGHNDQGSDNPKIAVPVTEYRENLRRMVHDVRELGGIPLLATSIVRLTYAEDRKTLTDEPRLSDWAEAMRGLARAENVPLVDLRKLGGRIAEAVGEDEALTWNAVNDRTHPSKKGALVYADIFLRDVRRQGLPVAEMFEGWELCPQVDPFWGCGAVRNPESQGMARGWNWLKAQAGNTHPGAVLPFGWVSVCAYSGNYSSGYGRWGNSSGGAPRLVDKKTSAFGFTHFHNSGVGYIGKFYNYFLFVPYRDGANIKVKSRLSNEVATPGYYAATLQDYGSSFEVTARPFAACHRYGFPKGKGRIRIDVTHAGLEQCAMMSKSYRESVEEYELKESGTNAWRGRIRVNGIDLHFSIRAKDDIGISSCNEGVLDAQVEGDSAETFIGFSLTSAEEAEKRAEEAQSAGFDKSYAEASDAWEAALSGVRVEFAEEAERRRFYSALYHSFIKPVDCGTGFVDYSTLWDIYKTQLPLVLSTQPQVARRLAMDMLAVSERYGFFPLTHMMTRDKGRDNGQAAALSVYSLADAFFRGALAKDDYVRMKAAFQNQIDGTKTDGKSPTYSLDLSGACRAAAFVADACGDAAYAEALKRKGEIWKTVYDSRTGYLVSGAKYYEGNHRNYSFRAHMGMGERVRMAGGVEKFAFMLDDFFRVGYIPEKWDPDRERVPRIGYFEGLNNESDMEAPYTYLWCGRADRMAEVLDLIRRCRFADGEGGCPGNNDSGGTSAWYVWSCLGLYPQTGTPYYLLGSPSVDRADVRLVNGVLRILVERESRASVCPVGYELNGRRFTEPWVSVSELERGGTLQFRLADKPTATRSPVPEWLD